MSMHQVLQFMSCEINLIMAVQQQIKYRKLVAYLKMLSCLPGVKNKSSSKNNTFRLAFTPGTAQAMYTTAFILCGLTTAVNFRMAYVWISNIK
jgi:hypothetical protein